ncbi:TonB-dependent receptor [Aliiglaciecola sp. LCG003]|uniref:TonB-dependent receptor n=1 Tax=Aliiglaciecola sp. LCG003 TaxID=3053655 RepID=UPI0025729AF2|nr:TonB-dependent receptor [Aliiglaciecola sp. LCG003]WJG10734.1 TonB-dependent receptor [Aliiglaciecola sp. LCG003]
MSKYLPSTFKQKPIPLLVALSLGLSGTHALAQEQAEVKKSGLETITVTAQKRAQNLQEVPVAVTAFTGDEMGESVIKDLYDLQTNVPGLGAFQSQSATNSSFSIRGVGTSSQNFGLESSVGLYVDGVYRARQNSMINNLVDIAAVEVLRGPQGTLFGKNTPSGAILIRTVAPSHDGDDGFVEATVGNFGLINYSGAMSFSAIEDVLAFRATGFGSKRDGIISDVNLGDDKVNDRDRWGARLQALYTPTDDLSIRLIADYAEIDEICCGAPVQRSNRTSEGVEGRFGSDAAISLLGGTYMEGGDAFFNREIAVSFLPESSMTDKGLSAEINYDIDDNYTFVAISAYRDFESYDLIDSDFTDADLFGTKNDAQQSSFSQEFRLDYTSQDLNYIVGVYYFEQELDLDYSLYTDTLFNPFFLSQFGGAFDPLFAGINQISALSGGAIAPVAEAAPAGTGFDHVAQQDHKSYAIYGQFDYKLNEQFTLTAGLRYTDETKDILNVFSENMPGGEEYPTFFSEVGNPSAPAPGSLIYGAAVAGAALPNIGAALMSGQAPSAADMAAIAPFQTLGWGFKALAATTSDRPDVEDSLKDDRITGTLKLSYQPDDDTLMYASVGTGYKSGGTNTDRIRAGFNPLFEAETSTSYELGIKKDFDEQNLRINAAAHYTTVEDFQANTFTGNGFNLQNAGDYEISGLELEATWYPMDTVEVNFGYALVNAEYKSFERGNCWVAYEFHYTPDGSPPADPGQEFDSNGNPNPYCNRSGDRPGGEPQNYAVVKVKKDFQMSDDIYSYVLAEYSYTGDMVLDGSNDPLTTQDAYQILNLRFFMSFSDYDTDVVFWARNVLDEEYINRTNFNTPLQSGKLNAYVAEPATYGITVKKRF